MNSHNDDHHIYPNFPPLTTDNKNLASWQPGASVNQNIRNAQGITSNWEYRKYLTENADKIIEYNQLEACSQSTICNTRLSGSESVPNNPYLYQNCQDTNKPYGYENSNLKEDYLLGYQQQCNMTTSTVTADQLMRSNSYTK